MASFLHLKRRPRALFLLSIVTYVVAVFFYSVAYQLPGMVFADAFHDGEYFAYFLGRTMGTSGTNQLSVHGGFEYLIPLLCSHLFGRSHYALPVFACYRVVNLISACLAYIILRRMLANVKWGELAAFSTFIAVPWLVGYREVFLLLSVCQLQYLPQQSHEGGRKAAQIWLGVTLSLGLFWSFNFGVTAALSVGLACCVMGVTDRLGLLRVVGGAVLTVALLVGTGLVSIPYYVANMIYAFGDSQYFKAPQSASSIVLGDTLVAVYLFVIAMLIAVPGWAGLRKDAIANTVCFVSLSYWLYAYGSYHLDGGHFIVGFFGVILLVCLWYGRLYDTLPANRRWSPMTANFIRALILIGLLALIIVALYAGVVPLCLPLFIIALAIVVDPPASLLVPALRVPVCVQSAILGVCGALFILVYCVRPISLQDYAWVTALSNPPANRNLVDDPVRHVADQLIAAGDHCVFDLSNSGLVEMVANLPPCTRFTYVIQAPPIYQNEMIAALAHAKPPVVIYSLSDWSYDFEGVNMVTRYPQLAAYLRSTYPYENCAEGYCLRTSGK